MKPIVLQITQTIGLPDKEGGKSIVLKAGPTGRIYWCSHWELIDALADSGLVRRQGDHTNFHHREYFLKHAGVVTGVMI